MPSSHLSLIEPDRNDCHLVWFALTHRDSLATKPSEYCHLKTEHEKSDKLQLGLESDFLSVSAGMSIHGLDTKRCC